MQPQQDLELILAAEFKTGYIIKNYIIANSVKSLPEFTFLSTKIVGNNFTQDGEYFASGVLYGEEVNLKWVSKIPLKERSINLKIDFTQIKNTFNKIKKKESATIQIWQQRGGVPLLATANTAHIHPTSGTSNLSVQGGPAAAGGQASSGQGHGQGSSAQGTWTSNFSPSQYPKFVIFLSSGSEKREGYKSISAVHTDPTPKIIRAPNSETCYFLTIPIVSFRHMIGQFAQCKSGKIEFAVYLSEDEQFGKNLSGVSIRTLKSTGIEIPIIETYGDIGELDDTNEVHTSSSAQAPAPLAIAAANGSAPLNTIDSTVTFTHASTGSTVANVSTGQVAPGSQSAGPKSSNKYFFDYNKIPLFAKLSSVYQEGNVRIYWQEGYHLLIAARIGSFGESCACLYNSYVRVS